MPKDIHKYKSKIDVRMIFRDHFNTLVNANTGKFGLDDILSFLIIPSLFSIVFIYLGFDVDKDTIETIVASLAIFVGLLFNALVLLIDVSRKQENTSIKSIIIELTANIAFSIAWSFVSILVMLLGFIEDLPELLKTLIDFLSFFCLMVFLLTFLMVLKRTYLVFLNELISNQEKPK